jgi:hypothetical protein
MPLSCSACLCLHFPASLCLLACLVCLAFPACLRALFHLPVPFLLPAFVHVWLCLPTCPSLPFFSCLFLACLPLPTCLPLPVCVPLPAYALPFLPANLPLPVCLCLPALACLQLACLPHLPVPFLLTASPIAFLPLPAYLSQPVGLTMPCL